MTEREQIVKELRDEYHRLMRLADYAKSYGQGITLAEEAIGFKRAAEFLEKQNEHDV